MLLIAGEVFAALTPANYNSAPFFAAAPLVAASLLSARATAVVALLAVLASVDVTVHRGSPSTGESVTENVTVLTVALLALGINRVVRRSDSRLRSARGVAEAAQRAVLPVPPARIGGLRIAARYVAAQADAGIGGDLYAVQDTPHGIRLIVGDVRGKGLGAVEAVAVVIGAFREAAEQERTLDGVAHRLESALRREGDRRANIDQFEGFTTAVVAEVPHDSTRRLRLVNRGHPPPLLLYADGAVGETHPRTPALPLGMGDLGEWPDRVEEWDFPAGATLLLFTDGVTEARDAAGVFYDPKERLAGRQPRSPDGLLDFLAADVARHAGGHTDDDMALLAVHRADGRGRDHLRAHTGRTPGTLHNG
ncbi:PP2C family protein-serine/threonine phosphatase [Streptomyces sp. AV19]|uniref:PP2C family protein-serine/threonine phosphatase n=1 Tax=Streptomyces sp. AV19 TaxID=2793068 RepID=UPI002413A777|nr:PP2C family protein-serine/threonine phosphatase [Streptomyces sp. AV19]MDG4530901.1 serine/threonine-protein phosphatase [Streptomyces sp. AV19]